MKQKEFLNECINCGYIGEKGLWSIEGYQGPIHIRETFEVGPERTSNPIYFDLEDINAKAIAEKYKVEEKFIEKLIMDGEPICPKCTSKNFFTYERK